MKCLHHILYRIANVRSTAGIISLLDDYMLSNGRPPLGFLNHLPHDYGLSGVSESALSTRTTVSASKSQTCLDQPYNSIYRNKSDIHPSLFHLWLKPHSARIS